MYIPPNILHLQRRINDLRVENSESKRFVPEKELHNVLSREVVSSIVDEFIPPHYVEEVVNFVIKDARKVFGVLILINNVGCINHFIQKDQFQTRCTDDLLPFTKKRLQDMVNDDYVADLFFEKQWEFSVPVFSGRIIPRVLERQTILPFVTDIPEAAGGYGSVHRVEIHPLHRPPSLETTKMFVRKELELDDHTYENEVRILATLQRLKHPNILHLVGCYTYLSKHNLISPYIAGGTLREYLKLAKPTQFSREEMLCRIAGLASAIWALHEFVLEDTEPSHKGNHQDLRPDNILVDGNRLILADFGLSSIKPMDQDSKTPFKGRKGYCQAPECVELGRPYQEHETNRATDIFALGCIIADLLIYLVKGASGVKEFHDAREFQIPPMCYYLYHKGGSSNEAVRQWLARAADEDGSQSILDVVQLVSEMLEISPNKRPSAAIVTARLYLSSIQAFDEHFSVLFAPFVSSPDASIEKARFSSWVRSQDLELYATSFGATTTGKNFESTIDILRQIKKSLESIDQNAPDLDCRSFLEVRTLNTQLLNLLSPERRSRSRSQLKSILLASIKPEMSGAAYTAMRSAFGDSRITRIAETKHLVAQVEEASMPSSSPSFRMISGPITHIRSLGQCSIANVRQDQHIQGTAVVVEAIQYQDQFRRQKLLPRIHALCGLLSNKHLGEQLRIPPFYALYDNANGFCFELLYDFPREQQMELHGTNPISLHELLKERDMSSFPSWESRLKLGIELAESLAAFHDVNWFHKDLTSFSVLFFPTNRTPLSARANRPYLIGFQHSRSAIDDFTEGPLQDRVHQRYHHPKYVGVESHQFLRFRPQFDHYSLGILLLEIGFWATIDTIMHDYKDADNYAFSDAIFKQQFPALAFQMGSGYVDVVRQCLTDSAEHPHDKAASAPDHSANLLFKRNVVMQLKTFDRQCSSQMPDQKRKREGEDEVGAHPFSKRKVQ